jgi:hypothetical protein
MALTAETSLGLGSAGAAWIRTAKMVEKLAEELLTYRADAKRGKGDCTESAPAATGDR